MRLVKKQATFNGKAILYQRHVSSSHAACASLFSPPNTCLAPLMPCRPLRCFVRRSNGTRSPEALVTGGGEGVGRGAPRAPNHIGPD